jgi:hypothetical protein
MSAADQSSQAKDDPTTIVADQSDSQKKKGKGKHPGQRKQKQQEKMANKGGKAGENGKKKACPVCGKDNHPVERCWMLKDLLKLKGEQKAGSERKNQNGSGKQGKNGQNWKKGNHQQDDDKRVNISTNINYVITIYSACTQPIFFE